MTIYQVREQNHEAQPHEVGNLVAETKSLQLAMKYIATDSRKNLYISTREE